MGGKLLGFGNREEHRQEAAKPKLLVIKEALTSENANSRPAGTQAAEQLF